jgi:hypothetical protein
MGVPGAGARGSGHVFMRPSASFSQQRRHLKPVITLLVIIPKKD